jgi:hypothetical protein
MFISVTTTANCSGSLPKASIALRGAEYPLTR